MLGKCLVTPSITDRLTSTFTKDFCVLITNTYSDNDHFQERFFVFGQRTLSRKIFCVWTTNTFKKDFLCLDNEHIFGGDQGDTLAIMDEILTTARDLELEVYEDDIEEFIIGHEEELTIEEFQEILNEEHQETLRNTSPSD
ncbi:UNVERIFIED_CONTAM: hypothetical protein NCL1_54804 [Trichonephila clavipes]